MTMTMINKLCMNSNKLSYVYFSQFPYYIYNRSTENDNFALANIGLGLIQCQQMFWFTIFGMITVIYFRNNMKMYLINICLFCLFFLFYFLYTISLFRTIYLLNLFAVFIEDNKI